MSGLRDTLAQYWLNIQGSLFPWLKEELGELTEKQQQLISILEMIRLEEFLHLGYGYPGRPPADRMAIARAFVAKQVYDMTTTRVLRIPRQGGHRFHGKLDSDSTPSWTPVPGQAGHLK